MTDTILITGGAGFIPSHFVRYLLANTAYSVVSVDRLDEAGSQERIASLQARFPQRFQHAWHDLRAAVNPTCHWARKDYRYVVHMAAASHVTRSIRDPMGFVLDNVVGTAHLLELCRLFMARQSGLEKVLYFSTDEVYGPASGKPFVETDNFDPNNPYAATKAAGECLVPAWANTFGLPIVTTRSTNAYGPGQDGEKFIPLVIEKVKRGETVSIHSRGGVVSSRCYVHVDDVSRATLTALEKGGVWCGPNTGRYNISGLRDWSNLEVAQRIAEIMGKPLIYELGESDADRPRHDQSYAVDDSRLRALGWEPTVPFHVGLQETVLESLTASALT